MGERRDITILAIETSCDETSAALVVNGQEILSNIIATQVQSHMRFGGVVPEIASRHHVEQITQIIALAIEEANVTWDEIDAIAVTKGPGLVGALLIGITAAKTLAFVHKKPLIGVDHIAGHIYASQLETTLQFPLMALVVSGGHTELDYMPADNQFVKIGDTRDDAVGEAYDKIGRVLDLPYPAGKPIDDLAKLGEDCYAYPRPMIDEAHADFSFSGLKSGVINHLHNAKQREETVRPADVACSFQEACVDVLVAKTLAAIEEFPVKQLLVCGGVAANTRLRQRMTAALKQAHPELDLHFPSLRLCGDNAAMIGAAAYAKYCANEFDDLSLDAIPGLDIED